MPRPQSAVAVLSAVVLFIALFSFLLSASMQKGLSHDEHMYVAAGALLADGLLPYKDYSYFHMPNLAFVYAALFQGTNYLLLASRAFSTLCATLLCGVISYVALRLFRDYSQALRLAIAVGSTALLVANPVFIYTSGLAWNHDLAALFGVLAFCLLCRGFKRMGVWPLLSGAALSIAVGTRLTLAAALLPLVVALLVYPGVIRLRDRLRAITLFVVGFGAGLLPSILLFALSPQRFLFGNVGYHELNTLYRQETGYERAMTLPGKLAYSWEVFIQPGTLLVSLLLLFLLLPINLRGGRIESSRYFAAALALATALALLAGALASSPTWYQYYYVAVPFIVLGVLFALAALRPRGRTLGWMLGLFIAVGVAVSIYGLSGYAALAGRSWVPLEAHRLGLDIKKAGVEGKVLTLAPILPLEAGLPIYKEFATGPFAWRSAPLLGEDERRGLELVTQGELEDFLERDPPAAILVGFEPGLDEPLAAYARVQGYRPVPLSEEATLWVRQP